MTPITLIIGPQKPVFCSEKFAGPAGLTRRRRRARRRPRSASRRLGARRPPPFFRGGNNGKQAQNHRLAGQQTAQRSATTSSASRPKGIETSRRVAAPITAVTLAQQPPRALHLVGATDVRGTAPQFCGRKFIDTGAMAVLIAGVRFGHSTTRRHIAPRQT